MAVLVAVLEPDTDEVGDEVGDAVSVLVIDDDAANQVMPMCTEHMGT